MTSKKTYRCSRCGEHKTRDKYYKNASHKNGRDNICKLCRKKFNDDYAGRRSQQKKNRKDLLDREASRRGCAICGCKLGREAGNVAHYHHRWPWMKNFNMSTSGTRCDEVFMNEMDMCDPLCQSCHTKVHLVLRGYKNIKDDNVHDYIDRWMRNTDNTKETE